MTVDGLPTAAQVLDALLNTHAPDSNHRPGRGVDDIMDPILALHRNNREQWDREDETRRCQDDDMVVAAAKRDIDQLNTARHGYIEVIDQAILNAIDLCEDAPLVTESPGTAIDRLSVLVIRLASTQARVASGSTDAWSYAERIPLLRCQLDSLEEAIATLFTDLAGGGRRFVAHDSLKLYGTEGPAPIG